MIAFCLVCLIGDFSPFLFLGEKLRTRVEDENGAKSMSSNARIYYEERPDHLPSWAPGRLFLCPFWGDRVVPWTRVEIFSATAGFLGSYA